MSTSGLTRKEAFFLRSQQACAMVFGMKAGVACPQCRSIFRSPAELTLEHVPPESVGGAPLCLTCRKCNNGAGHRFDYALAELTRSTQLSRALAQTGESFEGPVRVGVDGAVVNASIGIENNTITLDVHEERNNPAILAQQQRFLTTLAAEGGNPRLDITAGFRYSIRQVRLSILRVAYLVCFSWFGYTYALNRRLDIVREQLAKPEEDLIRGCGVNLLDKDVDIAEPLIALMTQPCMGVLVLLPADSAGLPVAASVVLPPLAGPEPFFDHLKSLYTHLGDERKLTFTATPLDWPTGPRLALDLEDD